MAKFGVIVAGAGTGQRFGGRESKVLAKLDGRPVFIRSLEMFVNRDDVCRVVFVAGSQDIEEVKTRYGANLAFMNVRVVEGGGRRRDSVAAGLAGIGEEADYVAVHDAARPCVSSGMIDGVFAEALKSGAAILACPLVGTIKRVSDAGVVDETVSHGGLFEAQTPQVFRRDLLERASANSPDDDAADDAQLVERIGHPVSIVQSDATNLKLTVRGDMTLAAAILKARPLARPTRSMGAFEEAQW